MAVDIQKNMIVKLRAKAEAAGISNIETCHAAAGQANLPGIAFDRALLVTVLGEIPDKLSALREIHQALKEDGLLSITELIPDPHYQTRGSVRQLCAQAGFEEESSFGNMWCYTLNFKKAKPVQVG